MSSSFQLCIIKTLTMMMMMGDVNELNSFIYLNFFFLTIKLGLVWFFYDHDKMIMIEKKPDHDMMSGSVLWPVIIIIIIAIITFELIFMRFFFWKIIKYKYDEKTLWNSDNNNIVANSEILSEFYFYFHYWSILYFTNTIFHSMDG